MVDVDAQQDAVVSRKRWPYVALAVGANAPTRPRKTAAATTERDDRRSIGCTARMSQATATMSTTPRRGELARHPASAEARGYDHISSQVRSSDAPSWPSIRRSRASNAPMRSDWLAFALVAPNVTNDCHRRLRRRASRSPRSSVPISLEALPRAERDAGARSAAPRP